ncbi:MULTISPECIES: hypothetical protein [Sphingomonas]|uniref:Lipoprotein n=1 Tax=Sphingomonas adhaesiva TaxID=28212 RepID=A0A2A4IBN4_9SPHN|nr:MULTISPECIES: hypothetical protein [Sphingomonas]PCG15596.1 hypothetical protein COA07_00950 [Sphingomonas adhaesiva]PZU78878.1 MAG: hypothetical protein DI530_09785 [Sphingomonas sp.]
MIARRAAITLLPILALGACGQRAEPAVAVANNSTPAPTAAAATPIARPAPAPTAILTCRAQIGAAAAAAKVATCRNVSPATHPPCNAANSCALIDDEIARSCALFAGDGAPMAGCTVDPKSAKAAADVVRRYYDAIGARDYATAWAQWGENGRPGQTLEGFTRGFADTRAVRVTIGTPGQGDAAAGSMYQPVPVTVDATLADGRRQRFIGTYVLRRVNDVDGASAAQLRWHIDSAKLRETPPAAQ